MKEFDLTAVLTSTPFWGAVVIVVALLLFKGSISGFFARAKRLSAFGTAVDATEQQQTTPQATETVLKEATRAVETRSARDATDDLLRRLPRNEYIAQREDFLTKSLDGLGIISDSEQTKRALLAVGAIATVSAEFEQLYNAIWGSQLKILQALNSSGTVQVDTIRPLYDEAAAAAPVTFAIYPFDNYLAFLVNAQLIERAANQVVITLKGRAFLTYLAHEGKALERFG